MNDRIRLRGIHRESRLPVVVVIPYWDLDWTKRCLEYRGYGEWEEIDPRPLPQPHLERER